MRFSSSFHSFLFSVGTIAALLGAGACGKDAKTGFNRDAGKGQSDNLPGDGGEYDGPQGFDETPDAGVDATQEECASSTTRAEKSQVDIIFVIDTSESMDEEISKVKQNINNFANSIAQSGLDYRVIMFAAQGPGIYEVCVPPPLGGGACGDNPPNFYHIDQLVYSTDSLELLIKNYDPSYGWGSHLRLDSTKVFIEITDDNAYGKTWTQFDQDLLSAQPPGMFGDATKRKYIFDAICGWSEGQPVPSTTRCATAVNAGVAYQELSNLTGGIVDSVCKDDYTAVLNNFAQGLARKLGCQFPVPKEGDKPADPKKVIVRYAATPEDGGTGSQPQPLTQVTDPSKCGQFGDSWYYDDPQNPTKIMLCPDTCSKLGNSSGEITIVLGCEAPIPF